VNDRNSLEDNAPLPGVESPPADRVESPPAGYVGRPRDARLQYKAILANASIGIAFTRERKIFLCNPKFAQMLGWKAEELIGQSGDVVYPSRESCEAMGMIANPILSSGRRLDIEWEMRRKDGSTFLCHVTAKAISETDTQAGTVWFAEDITERKRADGEIRRMVREQDLILGNATVGIAFVRNRMIQRCNRFLEEMVGAEPGALAGKLSAVLFASEADWNEAGRLAYGMTAPGDTHDAEWRFKRADGSTFLCRTRGRRIDSGGGDQEWIWSFEDVTLEREAEARVQRALAEQELILTNATVGISFARQRVFQRCNPRFEEMFGYGAGEMIGQSTEILFGSSEEYQAAGARMYAHLATGSAYVVERGLRRKDGTPIWCKVVAKAIDPARPEEGAIGIYDDITAAREARESLEASRQSLERAVVERTEELQSANRRLQAEIGDRRQAETRAQHLADHDALTGLPNRRLLEDRLTQALALSQRNRKQTAVMFVDLDRFKSINDSLGHSAGDVVLKEVSERLVKQLRVVDTICRMGGDEFVVVLPEIKHSSDAANVAAKILETVAQPFVVEGRELHITPSVGISVFPDDGRDAETLIRNADAAMYHAKETGRANYQFFTEQMNQFASRRLALESDLRQAVLKGEMRVYYQPVVDSATGHAASHEALLRWQHPARGLIEPAEFIHLAEDSGLIQRLGEWVLGEACRWANFIGTERNLPVSVNLSARQFHDPKLGDILARVLKESGLPPKLLELEVSELAVMQNTDLALAVLRKLRGIGVTVAIDGFGAAYSSLVGLRQLPVNKLKIDRSLVAEVHKDGRSIIAGIVGLAHALDLKVTAVGVETEAQKAALIACGCDYLQGFLTGRPADADTASKEYV
jgi:diguanylate cyclase (GGDEF)-like protein/PAS domain S-box-containing protein